MHSKKELDVFLSKLKGFTAPSFQLEQYVTPSSIAGEWLWNMAMRREISGRVILDAACGPGILGIGSLLLGAKKVYFVDKDPSVMKICMENYEAVKKEYEIGPAEFVVNDISLFDEKVDIVVQNPPFGTKEEHIDKKFLEKAFTVSSLVYSMHKYSTLRFIEAICADYGFTITDVWRYEFPIKAAFKFHRKPVVKVEVGLWRMEK